MRERETEEEEEAEVCTVHAATRDHLLRDLCISVHALDRHSFGINQTRHAHTQTDTQIDRQSLISG